MKAKFIFLLAFSVLLVTPVQAEFWVGAVTGEGNEATNVETLDWASSGSGVAVGLGPAGKPLVVGTDFDFLYQGFLFAVNAPAPDGSVIPFDGLNEDFEYTVVAQIPETVSSFNDIGGILASAQFLTRGGGLFYIYYDANPNANVAAGTGFEDGTLVAWGTIDANQVSNFKYEYAKNQGIGSVIVDGTVSYADPAYFNPGNIVGFRFEGLQNYPPIESATQGFFDGDLLTRYYPVDASNDLLLKVDASSKFIVEEEVVSSCRVTAGGVKDGITVPCLLKKNGMPDKNSCVADEWDTWGGQAGAQPGVDGNWTHHHVNSPRQSFVFHSNDLFYIGCSDPGACVPAAANAENRQIDFSGIGHFNNQKGYTPEFPDGDLCFMVHLEDIGEPGPGGKWPSSEAECTHCPGTPIGEGDCVDCTDYYEIKIYDSAVANAAGECAGTLIYTNGPGAPENCGPTDPTRFGYFTRAGNVQMHPENN